MSPSKNGPAQADADRPPDQVMNRNRSERHCLARLKSRLLIRVPAMHIRSVEIENYKCFGTKTKLSFGPGINVILGRNSSGKSALLEVLSLDIQPVAHRSLKTVPVRGMVPADATAGAVEFVLQREDFTGMSNRSIMVPEPDRSSPSAVSLGFDGTEGSDKRLGEWLLTHGLACRLNYKNGWQDPINILSYDSAANGRQPSNQFQLYDLSQIGQPSFGRVLHNQPPSTVMGWHKYLAGKVYLFRSSRISGITPHLGVDPILQPTGGNLTAVLDLLQRNKYEFERYNSLVSQVLPEIRHISVKLTAAGTADIAVWMVDPTTGRDDLAVPLSQTGSGVPHVLAMLYVFMAQPSSVIPSTSHRASSTLEPCGSLWRCSGPA